MIFSLLSRCFCFANAYDFVAVFVAVCFFLLYARVFYVSCRVLPDVLSLMFFHYMYVWMKDRVRSEKNNEGEETLPHFFIKKKKKKAQHNQQQSTLFEKVLRIFCRKRGHSSGISSGAVGLQWSIELTLWSIGCLSVWRREGFVEAKRSITAPNHPHYPAVTGAWSAALTLHSADTRAVSAVWLSSVQF